MKQKLIDIFSGRVGFGGRLKAARQDKEWSQRELAERAIVSQALVSRVEAGSDPAWRDAVALADALGLPLDAFR
jgi:transcriptional regulator with XRE-family HTH domain